MFLNLLKRSLIFAIKNNNKNFKNNTNKKLFQKNLLLISPNFYKMNKNEICENVTNADTDKTTTTNTDATTNIKKNNKNVIGKNKPVVLNLKEDKDHMKKYFILERYFGAKSKQTQFNCLGSDIQVHQQHSQEETKAEEDVKKVQEEEEQEITIESLSLNEKNNVIDRLGVYRDIYCMDAIQWLKENEISPESSIITSLPDITEVSGMNFEQYKQWFTETVSLITSKLSDKNVAIFYQTDIKRRWKLNRGIIEEYIDKGYLAQKGGELSGCKVIFHKIMTAHTNISNNKSSFTHMLCFAKDPTKIVHQDNTPDIVSRGSMVWSRAMGLNACVIAISYCRSIGSTTIIDPFCGKGSVLAVANVYGLNSIGVDLSTGKTKNSFNLHLDVETVNKFDSTVWKQSNNNRNIDNNKNDDDDDDDGVNNDENDVNNVEVKKFKKVKKPKVKTTTTTTTTTSNTTTTNNDNKK